MGRECFVYHFKGVPLWEYKTYIKDPVTGNWGQNPEVAEIPRFPGWSKAFRTERLAKQSLSLALNYMNLTPEQEAKLRSEVRLVKYVPEG